MFEQALIREIKQRDLKDGDGETLRRIAEQLVQNAINGDRLSITEIRDTLDGRPAQSVTVAGDPDAPLETKMEVVLVHASGTTDKP